MLKGQAESKKRCQMMGGRAPAELEILKNAKSEVIKLGSIQIDAPRLLAPNVVRLIPGKGFETAPFPFALKPADTFIGVWKIQSEISQSLQDFFGLSITTNSG